MKDPIERQEAIEALRYAQHRFTVADEAGGMGTVKWSEDVIYFSAAEKVLANLPSAQPEVKPISYADCANATMMMWIDKVLTDGEYKKIMDKLNTYEMKKREGEENE